MYQAKQASNSRPNA